MLGILIYLTYLNAIVFTLAFCYYSKYQFSDERRQSAVTGKWHTPGLIMRGCLLAAICLPGQWQDAVLIAAICAPLFDVGCNVIALNMPPLYPGSTAGTDKKLGMWKWPLYLLFLGAAIYLKIKTK